MGRVRRKKRKLRQTGTASRSKKLINIVLLGLTGAAIVALVVISAKPDLLTGSTPKHDDVRLLGKVASVPTTLVTNFDVEPRTLDELLALSPAQLAKVDLARMNLLCAEGLPGAEGLDVEASLAKLDNWARQVAFFTDNSLPDFYSRPHDFENSQAKFRMLLIISVLQREFGVRYNERGARNVDFSDSRNPFIHGMINDNTGGTCASMPILYIAVGRRLGYPVKLVLAKTHIFGRWESSDHPNPAYRARFNIEGTNAIFSHHPDSYYRTWPYPISDAELAQGWYLKPLTPAEELAVFLQNRAYCLMDNGRFKEAELAFTRSYQLAPQNPLGRQQIAHAAAAGRSVNSRRVRGGRNPILAQRMAAEQQIIARQAQRIHQQNMQHAGNVQPWPEQPQPGQTYP